LFFLNFFFSWANFYPDFFNKTLSFTYVIFCITLYLFVYNFFMFIVFKNKHFIAKVITILISTVLLLISVLPVFIKGWIFYFISN
jgi:hypothetical protein